MLILSSLCWLPDIFSVMLVSAVMITSSTNPDEADLSGTLCSFCWLPCIFSVVQVCQWSQLAVLPLPWGRFKWECFTPCVDHHASSLLCRCRLWCQPAPPPWGTLATWTTIWLAWLPPSSPPHAYISSWRGTLRSPQTPRFLNVLCVCQTMHNTFVSWQNCVSFMNCNVSMMLRK